MKAVLDCSAVIEVSRGTELGRALRGAVFAGGQVTTIAPELIYAEAASAASKYYRAGLLDAQATKDLVADALALVDATVPLQGLQAEALAESLKLGHSVYDMFYFVLARRCDAALVTLDRRLNHLCEQEGIQRIQLADAGGGLSVSIGG